ncbi:Uncharacterised protein [Mycobacteroides abscessus subsp. abscessus]|nr:Uncharacterised protein [Mycobacteroides abscessus subsp. abscessus]
MCRRTPADLASAADSRSRSGVTENGEQGASAIRTMASKPGSCQRSIASAPAVRMWSSRSTTESGGRPPSLAPRSQPVRASAASAPVAATRTASSSMPAQIG